MASRTQVPRVENVEVCHASLAPGMGQYNHAVMIGYHEGVLLLAWKNGATTEDKNGQRILYAQSTDGRSWTPIDGGPQNELFPNMTTPERVAALFVGPPIVLNGRQYVGASPGEPTGAAQGAQFCLWSLCAPAMQVTPARIHASRAPLTPAPVDTRLSRASLARDLLCNSYLTLQA